MTAFRMEDAVETNEIGKTRVHSSLPLWVSASVVAGAMLMAAGGVALVHPAMLVSAHAEIKVASAVYAGYLVSRNLALAGLLLVTLAVGARVVLSSLMLLTTFIQILDAGMDLIEGRWTLVPGVLLFAILFFWARPGSPAGHSGNSQQSAVNPNQAGRTRR